ncbi:hypothetical protein BHE74_00011389 [Ensete ventricosum]|nr:hypothetical protein BHE74_00011389 [Ensete ventricosum]RZR76605.1 hypothetical protein BHM03_00001428 [Ensete ventricosum]
MRALRSWPVGTLPPWLLLQVAGTALYGLAAGGCCPCGLAASSRPLQPYRGRAAPCGRRLTAGRPCGHHAARGRALVGGLAVASHPSSSSLRLLRKCSKNV